MKVSIIIIGDEILLGQVTDINSGELARQMSPYGFEVKSTTIVGDNREDISSAVGEALKSSDIVLTTGGLGPTKDDITKSVMLEIFGGELYLNMQTLENIKSVMAARRLDVNKLTAEQAMVPTSCRVIQNRVGTAPIMWFERDGKVVVNMPGVPFETREMFATGVLPALCERFGMTSATVHRNIIITGISESAIAEKIAPIESNLPESTHLAYLPSPRIVRLRVDSSDVTVADKVVDEIVAELGEHVLATADLTPAEILLEKLKAKKLSVATAESCTGGNIAHKLTLIPGSSEAMLGGVVSYANSVKTGVLEVSADDIKQNGAVSREVVEQMAAGVCRLTGAPLGIATSGIAGPGGGSVEKPVGTVWIATYFEGNAVSECYHFAGNRNRVIETATAAALIAGIRRLG